MKNLPADIVYKTARLFTNKHQGQEALVLLGSLWEMRLNVGAAQLARCILVLSEGNFQRLTELVSGVSCNDPRDLIMEISAKSPFIIHYGIEPFAEEVLAPPQTLDGANVLHWAWAGNRPFGFVSAGESEDLLAVYGLAICRYDNDKSYYRFSCGIDWSTIQDAEYESIQAAMDNLPQQYCETEVVWH